jgi:hypothetical protein
VAGEALEKLIEVMCSEMVLVLPNFNLEFKVASDASEVGYGAVLEQEVDSLNRSVAFFM